MSIDLSITLTSICSLESLGAVGCAVRLLAFMFQMSLYFWVWSILLLKDFYALQYSVYILGDHIQVHGFIPIKVSM